MVDGGTIPGADALPKEARLWPALWRSVFPVTRPPQDFWIARTAAVKKWIGPRPPQRVTGGMHLCTTLVSASYVERPGIGGSEIRVPPTASEEAMSVKVLFG